MKNINPLFKNKIFYSVFVFAFLIISFYAVCSIVNRIIKYDYEVIIIEGEYDENNIS